MTRFIDILLLDSSVLADITGKHDKDTKSHDYYTNYSCDQIESRLYEHDQHSSCQQCYNQNLFNHRYSASDTILIL